MGWKFWRRRSLEDIEAHLKYLKSHRLEERRLRDFPKPKRALVVSTERVACRLKKGEIHNAILLIYEDGTVKVNCTGECGYCEYEKYGDDWE